MSAPVLTLSDHEQEIVARLVRSEAPDPAHFRSGISCEDEMFLRPLGRYGGNRNRTLWRYFSFGKLMLGEVSRVVEWAFEGWGNVGSFLDFACGHGRFTRFLIQRLPACRVVASDIYPDAMGFQESEFGVRSVVSCSRPGDYELAQRVDVIFVASLFTHLPAATFRDWLERLLALLSDNGILLFSTSGMNMKPPRVPERDGFAFARDSESRSLSLDEYGQTFASPEYVGRILAASATSLRWTYFPHGFVGSQDLYVVSRGVRSFADLDFAAGLTGHFTGINEHGDRYVMGGWAADLGRESSGVAVEVWVDGVLRGTSPVDIDRPDVAAKVGETALVSGWSQSLPADSLSSDAWIMVRAVSQRGESAVLALDTAGQMLRYTTG